MMRRAELTLRTKASQLGKRAACARCTASCACSWAIIRESRTSGRSRVTARPSSQRVRPRKSSGADARWATAVPGNVSASAKRSGPAAPDAATRRRCRPYWRTRPNPGSLGIPQVMVIPLSTVKEPGMATPQAAVVVLYHAPKDAAAFERYYAETHLPLVGRHATEIGFTRAELVRFTASLDGSAAPFYRKAELWFPSEAALRTGVATAG